MSNLGSRGQNWMTSFSREKILFVHLALIGLDLVPEMLVVVYDGVRICRHTSNPGLVFPEKILLVHFALIGVDLCSTHASCSVLLRRPCSNDALICCCDRTSPVDAETSVSTPNTLQFETIIPMRLSSITLSPGAVARSVCN